MEGKMNKRAMNKLVKECAEKLRLAGGKDVLIFVGDDIGATKMEVARPQFKLMVLSLIAVNIAADMCVD
jgi:hypothetical protein